MIRPRSIPGKQLALICITLSVAQPQPASPSVSLNVPTQTRLDALACGERIQ
jgi:hypothetical protein